MLRKEITFKPLHIAGEPPQPERTEVFYFHLNQAEMTELELTVHGGLTGIAERIGKTSDNQELLKEFRQIILMSYGVREGDSFIKNNDIRDRFAGHPAFSVLYMEFFQKDGALVEFIQGILPHDLPEETEDKPKPGLTAPPLPPATVEAGQQIIDQARQ